MSVSRRQLIARNPSASQRNRLRGHALEALEARRFFAAHVAGDPTVYATIQAAVDAALPGGTITVDAGIYAEQVSINKTVSIFGARSGNDARGNTRGVNESIVTGADFGSGITTSAFKIGANGVTIDGFTVQGQTNQNEADSAGIVILPNQSGTKIYNNIIQNNVAGMFLANNSAIDPAIIRYNLFRANNNNGVLGGRGIYTDQYVSGGNLTNVTIDSNAFIYNLGAAQTTTTVEAAVALESTLANSQSDIRITNNIFDQGGKAVMLFNTNNCLIEGNTITYMRDQWSGALRFEGGDTNITIRNNTLYGNTGPAIRIDNKAVPGDNANFVINQNNFFGNGYNTSKEALIVAAGQYVGNLDARNNWWNSASGPSGNAPGTGEKLITNGNSVTYSAFATTRFAIPPTPYLGTPQTSGAIIQVEDFDHGGLGVAYHDTETTNSGGNKYRQPQGVDFQTTTDAGGGVNLAYVKTGEWLKYTINLPSSGVYTFDARVANTVTGAKFHVEVDGVNVTGAMSVPSTGGYQTFTTISKTGLNLTAGQHTLRLVFDTNGGNYNWFKLTSNLPTAVPVAPSNLIATPISHGAINLVWNDNSTNESNFILERSLDGVNDWTQIATPAANATSYSDSAGLLPLTQYFYRIRAINIIGPSTNALANATTLPAPTAPDAPSGLIATPVSNSQINLTWADNSNNETGFIIERSLDGLNDWTQIATPAANATSYSDSTGLSALTQYSYRVRATNIVGPSDNSNVTNATTLAGPTAPVAPSGLVAIGVSSSQINLTWVDNSDSESNFVLERSPNGVNGWTQIATPAANATGYSDSTGLSPLTQYSYRIRATNIAGPSGDSNVTSGATLAAALPASWSNGDIGAVGLAGSATESGGTYTVKGAGTDVWGTADSFHYAYRQITGDATIVVRVNSVDNTDLLAKAGIMFRETLAPNSKEASLFMTPGGGLRFMRRTTTGGSTTSTAVTGLKVPYWLKLVRSGSTFTAYSSTNGTTWTTIGSTSIAMGNTIYVGLAVTSKKTTALTTATFDNVTVS